jgi:hypothetical protein
MVKSVVTSAYEDHLMHIANFGNRLTVCRLAPINYHEAVTTVTQNQSGVALMQQTLTTSLGLGTYVSTAGLVSGRRLNVATQATITVSETANANHLAIVSTVRSALLLVTTVTSQAVTAGNQATVSSFNLEVRDPT